MFLVFCELRSCLSNKVKPGETLVKNHAVYQRLVPDTVKQD